MGRRKNSTKAERNALLKEMGYTEKQMDDIWTECTIINAKCTMLSNNGLDWRDLTIECIRQLPTLKEKAVEQAIELDKQLEDQQKAEEAAKEAAAYYEEHFEEIMVDGIESGLSLTEAELERVVDEFGIETMYGENRRWSRTNATIAQLCDRYFRVEWEEGLTENQENSYTNQPVEVYKRERVKVVRIKDWVDDLSLVKPAPSLTKIDEMLRVKYHTDRVSDDVVLVK